MKKQFFFLFALLIGLSAFAQTTSKKLDLGNRTKDHFMIQYGADGWSGRPDSVRTGGGFSRHFNVYFMLDKPFKNNQKMSLGIGAGIGSSNMFFKNTNVDVTSNAAKLPFTNADSTDHFKKFKVTTLYLEIPVEIRYFSNPANVNKSWKFAVGAKIGTLLKSYSKGKDLVNKFGQSLSGTTAIEKEVSKKFFNGTSIALTGRIGYGMVSLQGSYNINGVLRDGAGANMNKYSIGIGISGL